MQNNFFTSDHHFDHANIIKYCNRPFASKEEMDEHMIKCWNERITKKDKVFHIGDFTLSNDSKYVYQLIKRLNFAEIVWILGNHDPKHAIQVYKEFGFVTNFLEIKLSGMPPITLCHYPMLTWNKSHYGALNIFGHHHGNLSGVGTDPDLKLRTKQQLDVSVDTNNFYPYSLTDISQILTQPPTEIT